MARHDTQVIVMFAFLLGACLGAWGGYLLGSDEQRAVCLLHARAAAEVTRRYQTSDRRALMNQMGHDFKSSINYPPQNNCT
jgi:hypothetical protein